MGQISKFLLNLSHIIVTHSCPECDSPAREGLCQGCISEMPIADEYCNRCGVRTKCHGTCGKCLLGTPLFEHFVAGLKYNDETRVHVSNLKYKGVWYSGSILGQSIVHAVRNKRGDLPLPQALVAVPCSTKRLLYRGYNQAVQIARVVERELDIPIIYPLKKVVHTPSQIKFSNVARIHNVKNAFKQVKPIPYDHIAIIDDVVTSGATVRAVRAAISPHVKVEVWCATRAYA